MGKTPHGRRLARGKLDCSRQAGISQDLAGLVQHCARAHLNSLYKGGSIITPIPQMGKLRHGQGLSDASSIPQQSGRGAGNRAQACRAEPSAPATGPHATSELVSGRRGRVPGAGQTAWCTQDNKPAVPSPCPRAFALSTGPDPWTKNRGRLEPNFPGVPSLGV